MGKENFKVGNIVTINSRFRNIIGRLDEDSNHQLFHFDIVLDVKTNTVTADKGVILDAHYELFDVRLSTEKEIELLNSI